MTVPVFSNEYLGRFADAAEQRGAPVRIVGGFVRDLLSGDSPDDVDLASALKPEEVVEIAKSLDLKTIETGLQHGTVTVVARGEPFEITTLREDVSTDGRRAEVAYVSSFETDAARRDFTINAMSIDRHGKVHDYHGGEADLSSKTVRFVGDDRESIREDYLRILRFFRFRARFGGQENNEVFRVIREEQEGLRQISVERVWQEFKKTIPLSSSLKQVDLMRETGVLDVLNAPDLTTDAVRDNAYLLSCLKDPAAGLGILLGNPERADEVGKAWRLSNKEKDRAVAAAIVLADKTNDFAFWADKCDRGLDTDTVIAVLNATERRDVAKRLSKGVPVFPLKGADLLEQGFAAGPELGQLLKKLRDEWLESDCTHTKDDLMTIAAPGNAVSP